MILQMLCALVAVCSAQRPLMPSLSIIDKKNITAFIPKPWFSDIRCWTRWFDRDNPTGTGDWETVSSLKSMYPKDMCSNPTDIEVASVDGISLADAGNVFFANDHITGLICKNSDQKKCYCRDYKVRFVCRPPFCVEEKVCWTKWYDRDNPSGTGDWEHLSALRNQYPGQICASPSRIEGRTVDTNTPASLTGQTFLKYSPADGLVCKNGPNQKCRDYKVRFGCPCGSPFQVLTMAKKEDP